MQSPKHPPLILGSEGAINKYPWRLKGHCERPLTSIGSYPTAVAAPCPPPPPPSAPPLGGAKPVRQQGKVRLYDMIRQYNDLLENILLNHHQPELGSLPLCSQNKFEHRPSCQRH